MGTKLAVVHDFTRQELAELYALLNTRKKEIEAQAKKLGEQLKGILKPGGDALAGFAYKVALSEIPQISCELDYRALAVQAYGVEKIERMEQDAKEVKKQGTPHLVVTPNTQEAGDESGRQRVYHTFETIVLGRAASTGPKNANLGKKGR